MFIMKQIGNNLTIQQSLLGHHLTVVISNSNTVTQWKRTGLFTSKDL